MQQKIPPFTKYPFRSRSKTNCRVCGESISRVRMPVELQEEHEGSFAHTIQFMYNSVICSKACWIKLSNNNEDLIDELYQFIDDIQYELEILNSKNKS